MTELLDVKPGHKVLEVGAGSGYQAAILSRLASPGMVFTTEIISELYLFAKRNLENYQNVEVLNADGSLGYQKEAPYDRILVAASAPAIPQNLIDQLKERGKMIIPVGDEMYLVEKENWIRKKFVGYFSFVPLTGKGIGQHEKRNATIGKNRDSK
jgi:protein-L-isoaspartate(D-aspartate) O-methyltransferase